MSEEQNIVDFSHYRKLPLSSFLPPLERGEKLSAEYFDELLDRIEPPLLPGPAMQALWAELCWFHAKPYATRPPRGLRRQELLLAIASLKRDDVPTALIGAICEALAQAPPSDRFAVPRAELEKCRRGNRILTIRAVHRYFQDYVENGVLPPIPELAERARSLDGASAPKSEILKLTHEVIRDLFRMDPPSLGRLRNLVAESRKTNVQPRQRSML